MGKHKSSHNVAVSDAISEPPPPMIRSDLAKVKGLTNPTIGQKVELRASGVVEGLSRNEFGVDSNHTDVSIRLTNVRTDEA